MRKSNRHKEASYHGLIIEDQLADGRGVARCEGKVFFVEGALQGEQADATLVKKKKSYNELRTTRTRRCSPYRTVPRCVSFGICGGCAWQHANTAFELAVKQRSVLEEIRRIGRTTPEEVAPPLVDRAWHYRRRARLAVKYVAKKGRVLVGFREKAKPYVADMTTCEVLVDTVAKQITPLAALIGGLSIKDCIPQIEVAAADNATAFVFRVLQEPSQSDLDTLRAYAQRWGVQIYLQPKGPDSITPLHSYAPLYYELPAYKIRFQFGPLDFVQIHGALNRKMIHQAMQWLSIQPRERVLDLFCGLGNFSLPMARQAAHVTGFEGDASLIALAQQNAQHNAISNAEFVQQDLYDQTGTALTIGSGTWDVVVIDPPRSGAKDLLDQWQMGRPRALLYVSCHPGTLARDCYHLVHELGYRLTRLGIMNMFPRTSHIECMALFEPAD